MKIGIDAGISATKVVLLEGGAIRHTELWEGHPAPTRMVTFLKGLHGVVEQVTLTGVGSKVLAERLAKETFGFKAEVVDEFEANARVARYACSEERFITVSMGSGTSFVLIDGAQSTHIGGSALGGGTLTGLMKLMLPCTDYDTLCELAGHGLPSRIDLQIGDVSPEPLPGLPTDVTAVCLGRASAQSRPEDIAAGLINLVLQNIGVMAFLAGSGRGVKTFVMMGRMTTLPHSQDIFDKLSRLYGIRIIVPPYATYMTAVGAALGPVR